LKIDSKIKEKYVDITEQLYSDDSKGSDNYVCQKCYVKDLCYKIHLNIENPALKHSVLKILDERKEHQEFKKTMKKLLIEYEEEKQHIPNHINNNNNFNENYQNKEQEEIDEIDDFDYESSKQKHNSSRFPIRNEFFNESLLVDPDYIAYFKFQQKLIKNAEVYKYIVEDSLTANVTRTLDFKLYQMQSIKANMHSFSFFISVPKENLKYVFFNKQLTTQPNDINSEEDILIEKFIKENSSRLIAKKVTLYDDNAEFDCFYPGIIQNILEYDYEKKQLLIEISVLNHYLHETRMEHQAYPMDHIWMKISVALGSKLSKNFKGNVYELVFSSKFEKLRLIIIKNEKPIFSKDDFLLQQISAVLNKEGIKEDFNLLNGNQKEALMKVLLAQDYCTIEGFPGTGKTFLLVLAISIMRHLGKKVLISSFTNTALDSILMRLKQKGLKFHRFGNDYKINEELKQDKDCCMREDSFATIEEWKKFYKEVEIVGCTSIGANMQMLWGMRFDYCFVDEAGQLDEYNILGPIMLSDKFVLIGDTHQVNFYFSKDLLIILLLLTL